MMAKSKTVEVPVKTQTIVIPDEFPAGFGYYGRRESLSAEVRAMLQKQWDALTDDEKVGHLLKLGQHIEQDVPNAPTRLAS